MAPRVYATGEDAVKRVGSVRTWPQAPFSVRKPFSIPPQEGRISISEKAAPKVCAQSGSGE